MAHNFSVNVTQSWGRLMLAKVVAKLFHDEYSSLTALQKFLVELEFCYGRSLVYQAKQLKITSFMNVDGDCEF